MYVLLFSGYYKRGYAICTTSKKARLLLVDWIKQEKRHFPNNNPKYSIYKLGKKIL
jgi:hypothetical protein